MATVVEEPTLVNSSDESADKIIITDANKQAIAKPFNRKDGVSTRSFREGKEKKIGHRRVDDEGQTTYKKIQTSQIMSSIQLGIQNAIGSLASKPERDLLMQDFYVVETISFPDEGTNQTPAHHYSDFVFKVYAPIAFRYFRDLFGIHPDDFLISLCNEPLRELENPGASGSIFYLSNDDELIIKTVQHKEGEFLQKLLPGYYMNLNQNPRTLLPKFFGLFCFQCNSKNIRLVVMNNLLPSTIKIHQKYDLKGSTYKRKANKQERGKKNPTYKDLDFMEHHPEGLLLEAETYNALVKTIQRDCRVLESFKIMDYSLLVGIHNLDQSARDKKMKQTENSASSLNVPNSTDHLGNLSRSKSINRHRLVAHSTAMESIQADAEPIDEDEDVPSGGIPARNSKGERLLLFLGVIDILQSYRLLKKLEHTWKSMIHDGDTVSVHRPSFYAHRFQTFMAQRVFRKIPSLDLPEITGKHPKFRTVVSSYLALKHSPTKKKSIHRVRPPSLIEEQTTSEESVMPSSSSTAVLPGTSQSINLPTVLQDKPILKPKAPPPVPPRYPKTCKSSPNETSNSRTRTRTEMLQSSSKVESGDRNFTPSVSDEFKVDVSPSTHGPSRNLAPQTEEKEIDQPQSVTKDISDRIDGVSISQIKLESKSTRSTHSVYSESSSSTSGISSSLRTNTWTPPLSVEGSTPTWTEGTPSYTESSSSGDLACPTTPAKLNIRENKIKEKLYYQHETEVVSAESGVKNGLPD